MTDRPGPAARPVSCNRDCGASCALVAVRRPDGALHLSRNPLNHPFKRPCARGLRALESRDAPDRLTQPLIRTGERGAGAFRAATWDEALDRAAAGLQRVVERYGAQAILNQGGAGACSGALHNTRLLTARFLHLLGPVTRLTGTYSAGAVHHVLPLMFGSASPAMDARTLLHTRFALLWGFNPADTRFGNETEAVLERLKSAGVEIVVVDPRRSRTVELYASQWLPVRPGTDTAAMLGLLHELLRQGLVDREFLARYTHGFEHLERHVQGLDDGTPKTAAWAAAITGVPAAALRDLARRYGSTHPAALLPGLSIQRTLGGEESYRMTVALQAATGNTGVLGGSSGRYSWGGLPGPACPSIPVPEVAEQRCVPVALWPRQVLADIRAIYVCGTNFLNQGSDIATNVRAFQAVDLVICHELFLTPTARHADIVFPATHYLERDDIVKADDNYLYWSAAVLPPRPDTRDDYDIFWQLAARLGTDAAFSAGRTKAQWLDHLLAGSDVPPGQLDEFKRTGIHDGGAHERVGLARFIAAPLDHPLDTPCGKIELAAAHHAQHGMSVQPQYRGPRPDPARPLALITPHARQRINSTGANLPWVQQQEPQALWVHPQDAAPRGITDGALVEVQSETGSMRLQAAVTADIMPGVVCCLQGGWFTAGAAVNPAANLVTSLEPTMPSQSSRTHSTWVEVRAVTEEMPASG